MPAWSDAMPKGPKGERRPADAIGAAVMVGRIATGEIRDKKRDPGAEANRKGGLISVACQAIAFPLS